MSKLYPELFLSVVERNTVKCSRGTLIEKAMCSVNELGWGHSLFHIEPETNTGREEK